MKTIYKEYLESKVGFMKLPIGYKILCTQINQGKIAIWFECDSHSDKEDVRFSIIGTGQAFPPGYEDLNYIGTVQEIIESYSLASEFMGREAFVWHVYVGVK